MTILLKCFGKSMSDDDSSLCDVTVAADVVDGCCEDLIE